MMQQKFITALYLLKCFSLNSAPGDVHVGRDRLARYKSFYLIKTIIACLLIGVILLNFISYLRHDKVKRASSDGVTKSTATTVFNKSDAVHTDLPQSTLYLRRPVVTTLSGDLHSTAPDIWNIHRGPSSTTTKSFELTGMPHVPHVYKSWKESFANSSHKLFIFSAWSDERRLEDADRIVIRLVVISSADLHKNGTLLCRHFYGAGSDPEAVEPLSAIGTGPRVTIEGFRLRGYVVTCPVLGGSLPLEVGLRFQGAEESRDVDATVKVSSSSSSSSSDGRKRKAKKYELSACVSADFITDKITTAVDSMDHYRMVEWLVTQRGLGVQHVTIYLNPANRRHGVMLATALAYGRQNPDGFLTIRSYGYVLRRSGRSVHRLHSSSLASDCFYGYLATSKRVLILGLEDYLVPKGGNVKLRRLLRLLEANRAGGRPQSEDGTFKNGNFKFRVEHFFPNFDPRFHVTPYSIVFRYVLKSRLVEFTEKNGTNGNVRSVVSTSTCVITEFHGCKVTSRSSRAFVPYFVSDSVASIHRYESCDDEIIDCRKALSSSVIDDSVVKYEKVLIEKLRDNVLNIFLHNL